MICFLICSFLSVFVAIVYLLSTLPSKKMGGVDTLLPGCIIREFSAGCQPRHPVKMPFGAGIIKSPAWTTAFTARCQPRHPVKVSISYGCLSCPISSTTFYGALTPRNITVSIYIICRIINFVNHNLPLLVYLQTAFLIYESVTN